MNRALLKASAEELECAGLVFDLLATSADKTLRGNAVLEKIKYDDAAKLRARATRARDLAADLREGISDE